jgi:hypothetical protein
MSLSSGDRVPAVIEVVEPRRRASGWLFVTGWGLAGAMLAGLGAYVAIGRAEPQLPAFRTSQVEVKPTPQLLLAVKDLARVETTEVSIEKVVDLSDRQEVLFGLVEAKDAMLLVASGRAVVGIDLDKLGDGDVSLDPATGVARMRLPKPEVLSTSLDEDKTYVYTRSTDTLAKRNETLEGRARKEALAAVEKAAAEPDILKRARDQAERQMRSLALSLGAKRVDISWAS